MILTTSGFVSELMSLYPSAFTQANRESWSDRYISALNGVKGQIDFKQLWKIFESEYMSTVTPPTPKWIKDAANRAIMSTGAGDITNAEMITCVINGGFYEFVTTGARADAIQKMKDKSLAWWRGRFSDCPKEYENVVKSARKGIKNDK